MDNLPFEPLNNSSFLFTNKNPLHLLKKPIIDTSLSAQFSSSQISNQPSRTH